MLTDKVSDSMLKPTLCYGRPHNSGHFLLTVFIQGFIHMAPFQGALPLSPYEKLHPPPPDISYPPSLLYFPFITSIQDITFILFIVCLPVY